MPSNSDCREVATLLSRLCKRALAGSLDGVVVSFHSREAGEESEAAGRYARDKAAALKACLRQAVALGLYEAQAKLQKPQPAPRPRHRDR